MNRGREGSDEQCGEDMDGAWRANSYCTTFDTRAGRGRHDGANVNFPPDMRKRNCRMHCFHLECAIDWWCVCSLHILVQLSFLCETLIGPN